LIALLVPAMFAGARYVESDRQMTQIAQAQVSSVAFENQASTRCSWRKQKVGSADPAGPAARGP